MMRAPYRRELMIAATRCTAGLNLAMLRSQAGSVGWALTRDQAAAATRIAIELGALVREHAKKPTAS